MTKNYKKYREATKNVDMVEIVRVYDLVMKVLEDYTPKTPIEIRNKEVLADEMEYFENMLNATKTDKCCPRCKTTLYCSDLPDYDYVCPECDENFYNIEVK